MSPALLVLAPPAFANPPVTEPIPALQVATSTLEVPVFFVREDCEVDPKTLYAVWRPDLEDGEIMPMPGSLIITAEAFVRDECIAELEPSSPLPVCPLDGPITNVCLELDDPIDVTWCLPAPRLETEDDDGTCIFDLECTSTCDTSFVIVDGTTP